MIIKNSRNEKGQAMVEMAIVLPILLLVLFGIIEFGWIFYNKLSVENGTREAGRYTGIHYGEYVTGYKYKGNLMWDIGDDKNSTAVKVARQIIEDRHPGMNMSNLSVTVAVDAVDNTKIKVTSRYTIKLFTPYMIMLADPFVIESISEVRIE